MKNIPFAKDLYLYTGSTFDGSLIIKDVHGEPYMIDRDDEIRLYFKPLDKNSEKEEVQISLTANDEIMGEYPFKLTAEETESIEGEYEYYAFVHFADGMNTMPLCILRTAINTKSSQERHFMHVFREQQFITVKTRTQYSLRYQE